jgi:hypothetical protein
MLLASFLMWMSCITPRKGPARAYRNAAALAPFDAIIVPGIPYDGHAWDSVMKARVLWAWVLYKNGYTKNVIFSGAAVYTPYKESKIMGLFATKMGIPKEHIFYDTLAEHSTENVYYSYRLAQSLGFKSLALATDPFQSWMLRSFTRKRFATRIYHLPFVTDSLAVYNSIQLRISSKSLKEPQGWKSIKEREPFRKRFRGTLGKSINWAEYPNAKLGPL